MIKIDKNFILTEVKGRKAFFRFERRTTSATYCCDVTPIFYTFFYGKRSICGFNVIICPKHYKLPEQVGRISGYNRIVITRFGPPFPDKSNCVICGAENLYYLCNSCAKLIKQEIGEKADELIKSENP